ncbi:bactericidal permeability-increasing protein-like [Betta splendens]|uniref:Bactericidal permeability-increasing protein n=1 Tax=Betta splendens TaxID=158456 RepID=A0A6P7N2R3_BETSP|nr:bactericidal permeability-increasing protein-like [Betta splendens]
MLPSVLVVLMLLSCTRGENPAIQFTLTDKGLYYAKHKGADWIQEKLEDVTLPDVSGEVSMGLLGSIDYTLSDMTVTKCDLPEPSVEFYPDATGLKTSISDLSVALTGSWSTHYHSIHDGGSFDMAVFQVDVTSVVKLGKDSDGRLSVTSVSCDAEVGDVAMQFHGGASWIFQPFVKHFKGRIGSKIQAQICPSVEEEIVQLEQHLQAMNVSFDLNPVVMLDLPLTGLPVITASSLTLGLKGEFYSIRTHTEPPFKAQPFTLPEQQDYMLSLGLSEFTLNSASFGYYTAGVLQTTIDDSMIPSYCPVRLNTTSMGHYIPQLPKMFPGLLMSLKVYAQDVPAFSFQPDVVRLGVQAGVKAFAIQKNGTQTPLFTLILDSKFSGKVWTSDARLKGSVKMDNFTLRLKATEIGSFSTADLENLVLNGIQKVGIPVLNEKLAKGVILPRMKQVQLVNTVLKVEKGFVAMSSDTEVLTDRGVTDKL